MNTTSLFKEEPARPWCRLALSGALAGLIAGAGCKKSDAGPPEGTVQMAGVNIDLPKLDTAFLNASPEIKTSVTQIKTFFRGGRLARMVTELDKLSKDPGLTEPQKKLVNDLIGQLGQVMAKIPTPPG